VGGLADLVEGEVIAEPVPHQLLSRCKGLMTKHLTVVEVVDEVKITHHVGEDPGLRVVAHELELGLAYCPGFRVQVDVYNLAGMESIHFGQKVGDYDPERGS
jgi:hypothetical protein